MWEVSSSLIVKVLQKSEPEVMAEEVYGIGCWLPFPLVISLLALV